jgi:hypothetical protein
MTPRSYQSVSICGHFWWHEPINRLTVFVHLSLLVDNRVTGDLLPLNVGVGLLGFGSKIW